MKSSNEDFNEVNKLIELAIEGAITAEQSQQLNHWIVNDPAVRRHYCEYIQLTVNIERLTSTAPATELAEKDTVFDRELWNQLAREEKTAPEYEMPIEASHNELIQKVVYPPREKRKVSKFAVFTLVNVAAMIIFVVLLNFLPPKGGIEVATLTDNLDAKWANLSIPMVKGTRMVTSNERLLLREGYAQLQFDNQTRITLEGPVEFQILAEDRIRLNYGKVYLSVSKEAIGFSVYTKNSKIIDMGTEFGVEADFRGETRLHVIKGKTMLIAGAQSSRTSLEVSTGGAKKISAVSSAISDISCDSNLFVRNIDSEVGVVWKGQDRINLADIVGGGNGLGTGEFQKGIDPITGKPSEWLLVERETTNEYHPVLSSPYVDGVFVPNGKTQQVVSSQGHLFLECPVSNGACYNIVINSIKTIDSRTTQKPAAAPSILLHANMGVTFDLKAIRRLLPDVNISRFQSEYGIEKGALRPNAINADFWVLVDGKVRHKKTQVQNRDLFSVDIELSEKDRFLTLITTDGLDQKGRIVDNLFLSAIDSDWGMFANPTLLLE